ncbi:hypothetical protein IFM89_003136 [Coptis chinensis]|uniref:Uncharacterized protein n=1 Tax=Coptis chinensis TaxID=261450 RepID=A0A835I7H2_9MAGN|nr:hypothetical protein IFM89_003136 [Coptis chinensis]
MWLILDNADVLRRMVRSSLSLNELRSPVTKDELVAEVFPFLIIELLCIQDHVFQSNYVWKIEEGKEMDHLLWLDSSLLISSQTTSIYHLHCLLLGEFEVPLLLSRSIPLPDVKLKWTLDIKIRRK